MFIIKSQIFLPVAYRYRNTWNGGEEGRRGGGQHNPKVLLKNGFLTNCLMFVKPKFVVTTK